MIITPQPFKSLCDLIEDHLVRAGFAVVSRVTMDLIERVERSPSTATKDDFDRIHYAIYSGPAGEYWPLPERPEWSEPVEPEFA